MNKYIGKVFKVKVDYSESDWVYVIRRSEKQTNLQYDDYDVLVIGSDRDDGIEDLGKIETNFSSFYFLEEYGGHEDSDYRHNFGDVIELIKARQEVEIHVNIYQSGFKPKTYSITPIWDITNQKKSDMADEFTYEQIKKLFPINKAVIIDGQYYIKTNAN